METLVARVSILRRLVAVAGRTLCAVEPGFIRSGECGAVQRLQHEQRPKPLKCMVAPASALERTCRTRYIDYILL